MEEEKLKDNIIIELSPKAKEQLKELQHDLNATSGAQVIENSLNLIQTLNQEVKSGSEIIIHKPNKETKKLLFE